MNYAYYEELRLNNGSKPKQITEERFWYLLEVLPPCKWTRLHGSESFYVSEAETEDLHTWCLRIAGGYFELVAPKSLTHEQIIARVVPEFQHLYT